VASCEQPAREQTGAVATTTATIRPPPERDAVEGRGRFFVIRQLRQASSFRAEYGAGAGGAQLQRSRAAPYFADIVAVDARRAMDEGRWQSVLADLRGYRTEVIADRSVKGAWKLRK
jgi:hypothetical protein